MLKLFTFLAFALLTLSWDHNNQYAWPSECLDGSNQSPIRIPAINTLEESDIRLVLDYNWTDRFGALRILDNGHYLIVCVVKIAVVLFNGE